MDEDSRGVQNAAKRRRPGAGKLREHGFDQRPRSCPDLDLVPGAVEDGACRRDSELVWLDGQPLVPQQLVDRGQVAKFHTESVGTSSRRSAVNDPAARAPTSSTALWSIFSGRTPAAMFVTTEIPRQRIPMCRAAITSGTVDIPARSPPTRTHEADLGRGLELRAEPGCVDTLGKLEPEPVRGLVRQPPQLRVVGVAHIGEARSELLVVRPDERRRPLEVHVVGDEHEHPRPERLVDRRRRRS